MYPEPFCPDDEAIHTTLEESAWRHGLSDPIGRGHALHATESLSMTLCDWVLLFHVFLIPETILEGRDLGLMLKSFGERLLPLLTRR